MAIALKKQMVLPLAAERCGREARISLNIPTTVTSSAFRNWCSSSPPLNEVVFTPVPAKWITAQRPAHQNNS